MLVPSLWPAGLHPRFGYPPPRSSHKSRAARDCSRRNLEDVTLAILRGRGVQITAGVQDHVTQRKSPDVSGKAGNRPLPARGSQSEFLLWLLDSKRQGSVEIAGCIEGQSGN